jgi:ferredoxin
VSTAADETRFALRITAWEDRVKIRVDPERCTGHGRCYSLAPEVFEPDDEGHSVVILEEVPPEFADKARIGVENCPEQAISIVD